MTAKPTISVTITGADDGVDIADLVRLTDRFPFVEWGVLFSRSRQGQARYPSAIWIEALRYRINRDRLAAHVCGAMSGELMTGLPAWFDAVSLGFGRVQINGFHALMVGGLAQNSLTKRVDIIAQVRSPEQVRDAHVVSVCMGGKVSALFDESGGRGITSRIWPHAPQGLRTGYAGGIGPDSIKEALDAAFTLGGLGSWVDMESGVRTDDRFDLGKVEQVLTKAEAWLKEWAL